MARYNIYGILLDVISLHATSFERFFIMAGRLMADIFRERLIA